MLCAPPPPPAWCTIPGTRQWGWRGSWLAAQRMLEQEGALGTTLHSPAQSCFIHVTLSIECEKTYVWFQNHFPAPQNDNDIFDHLLVISTGPSNTTCPQLNSVSFPTLLSSCSLVLWLGVLGPQVEVQALPIGPGLSPVLSSPRTHQHLELLKLETYHDVWIPPPNPNRSSSSTNHQVLLRLLPEWLVGTSPSLQPNCSCSPGWSNGLITGLPASMPAPLQFALCIVARRIYHSLILWLLCYSWSE